MCACEKVIKVECNFVQMAIRHWFYDPEKNLKN